MNAARSATHTRLRVARRLVGCGPAVAFVLIVAGCATAKIDWNARIGTYTYDQAVIDLGPPERAAKLTDGTTVADWMTRRGVSGGGYVSMGYGFAGPHYYFSPGLFYSSVPSPDYYVRLTFDPEGKLKSWKKFTR